VRTSVSNVDAARLALRVDDVPDETLRVFVECRRSKPPWELDVRRSTPTCRSATLRANRPTNGERAEPPGSVAVRSTVAVGSSRGPVRVDTVRRTLCRRSAGRSANVASASGDVDRRRDGAEERPALGDVDDAVDDGETRPVGADRVVPGAVVRVAVARVAVDGDVRVGCGRVVVVGAVERDRALGRPDSSACEATRRCSEARAAAADRRPPLTGARRTRSPGRTPDGGESSARRATRSASEARSDGGVGGDETSGDRPLEDELRRRDESSVADVIVDSGSSTVRRQPGVDQDNSSDRGVVVADEAVVADEGVAVDADRRVVDGPDVGDIVDGAPTDEAAGAEVTGDDFLVADRPPDPPSPGGRSASDDGNVVHSGRALDDRRTASGASRFADAVVGDGATGERRAGGPSRSDDFPAGKASGRARGGRGVAGRTAG
jgi:hypothetical protein